VRKIEENRNDLNRGNIKNTADKALFWAAVFFLAASALLLLFEYQGIHGFDIGLKLLRGTAVAALIGGIADWYGVTSIFDKPLHVSYKTEIVLNRKASFIESIKDFIGDDILSEKNVRIGFERLDITDRIIELVAEEKGKKEGLIHILSDFLAKLVIEILSKLDVEKAASLVKEAIINQLGSKKPSLILIRFMRGIVENRHFERIVSKVATELESMIKLKSIRDVVNRGINMAILNYSEKAKGRGFVADMVQERLKKAIFSAMEEKLLALKRMESRDMEQLKQLFMEFVEDLEANQLLLHKIDKGVFSFINENNGVREKMELFLSDLQGHKSDNEEKAGKYLEVSINYLLELLLKEDQLLVKFEKGLTEYLIGLLNENRERIKGLVDKNLRVMSDKELMEFLRANTENELQFIRLNGMLFGTLIGFFVTALKLALGIG